MDNGTLNTLLTAWQGSPENGDLAAVVLRALVAAGRRDEAAELVDKASSSLREHAPAAAAAASALRSIGRFGDALGWLHGDAPVVLLERARTLISLKEPHLAADAYRLAVQADASLGDDDLERVLVSTEDATSLRDDRTHEADPADDDGRRAVIANDDTMSDDVRRLLEPAGRSVAFRDVGGLDGVKKEIHRRIIMPFLKPGLFERFRKRVGGGILLYGPPGCGKTLLARATAGECDAAFVNVSVSDVLDMYIGESQKRLAAIFDYARSHTPCVLFFDEIEALGGKRMHSRESISAGVVSQFLAEMDGFAQNNQGVLVLGATNVPWALDAAFRRPGRFDRVLFVPPPDREARVAILRLHLDDRPVAPDLDVKTLAAGTSGFSGADLEHLVDTAANEAIEATLDAGHEVPISREHIRVARDQVRATTEEWLTTARNYARYANEGGQYDEVIEFLQKNARKR